MTPTHLNEETLEALIVAQMTTPDAAADGPRWVEGAASDVNAAYCLDLPALRAFLTDTQPGLAERFDLGGGSPTSHKFLARLQGEITRRGIVDCLRHGIDHNADHIELYFPHPTPGNPSAAQKFAANRFTITRQVHYSTVTPAKSVDLVAFVNGMPVATFELKNSVTKQTVDDAVQQYKTDRDPREPLFAFGRTIAHFAVDDRSVRFCTRLAGNASWFLPFDQGHNDGGGNPPNPHGMMTDYLWTRILTPDSLADIIENFAAIIRREDPKTKKKTADAIFPRYHQLDVVRALLAHVRECGAGTRYLIQHSAGSGKSNSIAWLALQLIGARHAGTAAFDAIIVATDRVILDRQIRDTIKGFTQVKSTVAHAESSRKLREAIEAGRKVIITTVQKFPYIVEDIGGAQRDRRFAIIIDEAHSSQGGKASAAIARALSKAGDDATGVEDFDVEDALGRLMQSKKLLPNASYFAFTATPKNKTLETFGVPYDDNGTVKHRPFHSYTMKQAIQERFIIDVLANYVPVDTFYRLVKTIEDDPEFDAKRASKKLRTYVEGQQSAIRRKAEVIVDHFHAQVYQPHKVGGKARAMVVTSSIARAIAFYEAISTYLTETGRAYKAIVAFSDVKNADGSVTTEAQYNGFPSSEIPTRIAEDPYRILVVADKFQTGYDQPLLYAMYVDKPLSDIRAVQTLSRLNRAHPQKDRCVVLDFANDVDTIRHAFQPYYRTTVLSDETDPNKLNDLAARLWQAAVFTHDQVEPFVAGYLRGDRRDLLDPLVDVAVAEYTETMDQDEQIAFKSDAKAFVRTYGFLSAILPFTNAAWEKLSIYLDALIPKLPTPQGEDLADGILETVDLDSFRAEKRQAMAIALDDDEGSIAPAPADAGGGAGDVELERLTEILDSFNQLFGDIDFTDEDRIRHRIADELPASISSDEKYVTAVRNNDQANARVALDGALARAMLGYIGDETRLYKLFSDNPDFKSQLATWLFHRTYDRIRRDAA